MISITNVSNKIILNTCADNQSLGYELQYCCIIHDSMHSAELELDTDTNNFDSSPVMLTASLFFLFSFMSMQNCYTTNLVFHSTCLAYGSVLYIGKYFTDIAGLTLR